MIRNPTFSVIPIVWFLVVFPVLVLFVFGWLVSRHHWKLYSPADFRDDEGFIRVLSPAQQKLRLEAELEAVASPASLSEDESATGASPVTEPDRSTITSNVVLAEALVFRDLEQEFRSPVRRQIWMRLKDSDVATFDGVIEAGPSKDTLLGVEVKFIRSPISAKRLQHLLRDVATISLDRPRKFRLILAIVTDEDATVEGDSLVRRADEIIRNVKYNIELRVYDLNELKKKYGLTNVVTKR